MIKSCYFSVPGKPNLAVSAAFYEEEKLVHLWRIETGKRSEFVPYRIEQSLGEIPLDENTNKTISDFIDKVSKGLVRCCYCGKWIPESESEHHVPAGCSCRDCRDKGRKDEAEYLSYND